MLDKSIIMCTEQQHINKATSIAQLHSREAMIAFELNNDSVDNGLAITCRASTRDTSTVSTVHTQGSRT